MSVVTIGELRHGVERIRYRGDKPQAQRLERWLPLDEQIAATALIHDLVVVSRSVDHFAPTGVQVINPFA